MTIRRSGTTPEGVTLDVIACLSDDEVLKFAGVTKSDLYKVSNPNNRRVGLHFRQAVGLDAALECKSMPGRFGHLFEQMVRGVLDHQLDNPRPTLQDVVAAIPDLSRDIAEFQAAILNAAEIDKSHGDTLAMLECAYRALGAVVLAARKAHNNVARLISEPNPD